MSAIRDGRDVPPAWVGLEFAKLLEEHARGKLAGDLLKPEPADGEPEPEDGECEPS